MALEVNSVEWLRKLLEEVQLEHFFTRIRDDLQVTRFSHFDYVQPEDLENIGMGKPAVRRLMDSIKKKKSNSWARNLIRMVSGGSSKDNESKKVVLTEENATKYGLTCLIQEKDIRILSKLGDGLFGIVKKGEWTTAGGKVIPVAVKVLKDDVVPQQEIHEDFIREVQSMHQLDDSNLIRLYGVTLTSPMQMITELAPFGCLLTYLQSHINRLPMTVLWDYALQVCKGMTYLESKRMIHRDLACRNLLMFASDRVKIGDFGLMRTLGPDEEYYIMKENKKVPFPWCAPESLRMLRFSHSSDVWMYGVTIWEMFTFGQDPWFGLTGTEILNKVDRLSERLNSPQNCSSDLRTLLQKCWQLFPMNRPNFHEIKEYLMTHVPQVKVSLQDFRNYEKLTVRKGDSIVILDGSPDVDWWRGQNLRTCITGEFPKNVFISQLKTEESDKISKPLNKLERGNTSWHIPDNIHPTGELDFATENPTPNGDKKKRISLNPGIKLNGGVKQQFSYKKFQNDEQGVGKLPSPMKPDSGNGLLVDIGTSNDFIKFNGNVRRRCDLRPTSTTVFNIMDQPIDIPEESEMNSSQQNLSSYTNIENPSENIEIPATSLWTSFHSDLVSTSSTAVGGDDKYSTNNVYVEMDKDKFEIGNNLMSSFQQSGGCKNYLYTSSPSSLSHRYYSSVHEDSDRYQPLRILHANAQPDTYVNIDTAITNPAQNISRPNSLNKLDPNFIAQLENSLSLNNSPTAFVNYPRLASPPRSNKIIDNLERINNRYSSCSTHELSPFVNESAFNDGQQANGYCNYSSANPYQTISETKNNIYDTVADDSNSRYYSAVATAANVYTTENLDNDARIKIAWLVADLKMDIPDIDAVEALNMCDWDIPSASRYIKLQSLLRLRIGSRKKCEKILNDCDWNLEEAVEQIMDSLKFSNNNNNNNVNC